MFHFIIGLVFLPSYPDLYNFLSDTEQVSNYMKKPPPRLEEGKRTPDDVRVVLDCGGDTGRGRPGGGVTRRDNVTRPPPLFCNVYDLSLLPGVGGRTYTFYREP